MGNGVSGDQGNLPSRGKRDVSTSIVKAQHDWQLERAVAPKQETLSLPDARNAYIGAQRGAEASSSKSQLRGLKSEEDTAHLGAYIGILDAGPSSSKDKSCSNARLDAYTVGRPRDQKDKESETHSSSSAASHTEPSPASKEDDARYVAYSACSGAQLRNRKSSVMKDDVARRSSVMKDDISWRSSVMKDDVHQ